MALTPAQMVDLSVHELHDKLTEESAEVVREASDIIKAVAKLNRFGPRPFAGGVQYDNPADVIAAYDRLRLELGELDDLMLEFRCRHERN